jgi:hypothetical protein
MLYGVPRLRVLRAVPVQLLVLLVAVPAGLALGLGHLPGGPFLVRLPTSLASALVWPTSRRS